jgi:hypothetical protein
MLPLKKLKAGGGGNLTAGTAKKNTGKEIVDREKKT